MPEMTQERWKRGLRRELERDYKAKQRVRLATLRERLKETRAVRAETLAAIVKECKRVRTANSSRLRAERAELERQLRDLRKLEGKRINAMRDRRVADARAQCAGDKETARAATGQGIEEAQAALAEERSEQASLRILTRKRQATAGTPKGGSRAAEKRAESDSEVEHNLSEKLIPVWRKVRRDIKAGARSTRTEAFLHWAHDNPADVARIQDVQAERDIEELVAQEEEQRRAMGEDVRELDDAELLERYDELRDEEGDVPF